MLRLIEDEDAYENYQNKPDDFETEIEEVIIKIDSVILKPETPPVIHPFIPQVVSSPTLHQNHSIKLPQIDVKRFSGDVTKWQTFFDSFEVAAHSNNKLFNIEKMNYLLSYLIGRRSFKNCIRFRVVRTKLFSGIEM